MYKSSKTHIIVMGIEVFCSELQGQASWLLCGMFNLFLSHVWPVMCLQWAAFSCKDCHLM
jgi:uncharacterized membrane protein